MQNHNGKFKTFEFYTIAFSFSLCAFSFLLPVDLFVAEPNALSIKWAHIFIRADVNEVHFENILVFERETANHPWEVSIDLPDGAIVLGFDEPNETELLAGGRIICKAMAADSLIDSVGFSFALPNRDGTCQTLIKPDYQVDIMVVYVSGPGTQLVSNALKSDEYGQSHSEFSSVYTASNLTAGTKIEINLRACHAKIVDCRKLSVLWVCG